MDRIVIDDSLEALGIAESVDEYTAGRLRETFREAVRFALRGYRPPVTVEFQAGALPALGDGDVHDAVAVAWQYWLQTDATAIMRDAGV